MPEERINDNLEGDLKKAEKIQQAQQALADCDNFILIATMEGKELKDGLTFCVKQCNLQNYIRMLKIMLKRMVDLI